jgi:hypothetical protein
VTVTAAVDPQQLLLANEVAERDGAGGIGHRSSYALVKCEEAVFKPEA